MTRTGLAPSKANGDIGSLPREKTAEGVKTLMRSVNPGFIPRNHQVERAIAAAIEGDLQVFRELLQVLERPFDEQPEFARFAEPPLPAERVARTFCGT